MFGEKMLDDKLADDADTGPMKGVEVDKLVHAALGTLRSGLASRT